MNIAVRDTRPAQPAHTQRIELRLATEADAGAIAQLIGAWFPLTVWSDCLTYDADKAAHFIAQGIASWREPFLLAVERGSKNFSEPNLDGNIVGIICWHLDARLTAEPVGVLDLVYVVPRLRRSDLGRRLIMQAIDYSKSQGAAVFNFPIASGMPAQRSLINMLVRHIGAEPVGVLLRKVL